MSGSRVAPYQDGIPVVANTTARAQRFPTPDDDQRVFNKGTHAIERYSVASGGWLTDAAFMPALGLAGDGVTDDTAALNAAATAALGTSGVAGTLVLPAKSYLLNGAVTIPAGVSVDATGSVITLAATVSFGKGAKWTGGTVTWTVTTALDAFVPTADYCQFVNVEFVGSGAIGTAGAPLYQRAINGTKYNYGVVSRCRFTNMTVGVWVGGASTDPTPLGWRVVDNTFEGIVGYRGQSEGYAVLFTPASRGTIRGNVFSTIARHAIYLAGGACANTVAHNTIDGTDNIAIQLNTFFSQPATADNVIVGNVIRNVTRSIAYGYRSSIGIGIYGNNLNTVVLGNRITGVLDTGIDWSSASTDHTTSCVGFGAYIANNVVDASSAGDAGIRTDNPDGVVVARNSVTVANTIYGLVVTGSFTPQTVPGRYEDNVVRGLGSSTVGVRISSTGAAHGFARNMLLGLGTLYGPGGASGGFTISQVDGALVAGDADLAYAVGVNPNTVLQSTTLTANRTLTLGTVGALAGGVVRIARPSSGAFTYTVKDGGGTILKALNTGQWIECAFDGTMWQSVAFGSL